ncbi:hypothetical protein VW23_010090 [Devosia insulae DS-56]|uniref:Autotransporter domain-containing protein n=1 Tax=Devosia insulae DS-56 TaxID=1116389 RepID=A0A1E5XVY2_9HYPH|nr:hypothetical protein VW23_010090 [Devosia insulae DS-56]
MTITGNGTSLVATGTQSMDLGATGSGQATLNVEAGGLLQGNSSGIRLAGTTAVNVTGAGSTIDVAGFFQLSGNHTVRVTNGGLFDVSGTATFGAQTTNIAAGWLDGEVSGAGSRLQATTLALQRGSLSVLAGGVVEATTISVSTAAGGTVSPDFNMLVSGGGSALNAISTFTLATRGVGVLTIANDGLVRVNGGGSALALGGALPASDATLNIGGAVGEAAAAAGTLQASAITLAASAEINFNHTETGYVFDIPINGSGAINQVAGRTIFGADQLGFTGLTTISGGMLEVNKELGGTVSVLGGTLAGIGKVGATSLAAGGTIAPGSNGIGRNGIDDPDLTIAGDYVGGGGLLQIETVLGDDTSATDRLVITGNSVGTTNVRVTNLGGAGGQTTNGIKIIDVGGTSDGIFSLLGDTAYEGQQAVIGGAYLYSLQQGSADGDWYLRSIVNPDDTPVFQPAAPVIETYAASALQAFNTTETLQQRVGNRSWSGGAEGNGIWGRIDARRTSLAPANSTTSASYEVDTWRLQAGADGVLAESEAGTLVGGVNLQLGTISAAITSTVGNGGIEGTAFGLGGTLTWYGNEGLYLDAQGKLNWFDSTLSADLLAGPLVSGNAGFGYALSLESGQQVALGDGWSVTPQAQLAYSSVDFDAFDSYGSTVALQSGDSLLGRLGLSADYESEWQDTAGETGKTHAYGIANLSYEFLDGTATSVGADTLVNETNPLWGSVRLGGSVNWAGDALSLYGEANFGTSLNQLGDSYSLGVTAGIRGKL